jgi:hypothetical protein
MALSFLTALGWDEFNSKYPGAWAWLQRRTLTREKERLERLPDPSPVEARRLAELRGWQDVMDRAEASRW